MHVLCNVGAFHSKFKILGFLGSILVFQLVESPRDLWACLVPRVSSRGVLLQLLLPCSCFIFLVIFWSYPEALLSIQEIKKNKLKLTKSITVETVTESGAVPFSPNVTVNP